MFPARRKRKRMATACLYALVLAFEPTATSRGAGSGAPEPVTITTLQDMRRSIETRKMTRCALDLEAVVCAVDTESGALALQDETGTEVCMMELRGRTISPGARIRIRTPECELIRRKWSVAIAPAPVVDNRGVHSARRMSGRIELEAGMHPFRLFYFNALAPAVLEVSYSGPGIPLQPIPSSALFREPTGAGPSASNFVQGLRYSCYEDTPSTMDDLRNMEPVASGVTSNVDVSLRRPEDYVAMQFQGYLEIPASGVYTFSTLSDDGSELFVGGFHPTIEVVSTGTPPPARGIAPVQPPPVGSAGEWAVVEGRVNFVGEEREGLELELQEGNLAIRLWLPSREGVPEPLLLHARVRATGVYQSIAGLDGESASGLLSVVDPANLEVLDIAPEQWEKHPPTSLADLASAGTGPGLPVARLQGEVTGLDAGGGFLLSDPSGPIRVQPAKPGGVTTGLVVEVLGGVVRDRAGWQIGPAFVRRFEASPSVPPTLTTAAQVQQLSADEAAREYPVRVRGVVTCLVEWGGGVVQDDTRGVFFDFRAAEQEGIEPRDYVEIKGVTAVGDFAPIIMAESVRVLGRGEVPEPVRPNWNQLMSGSLDSQYAEVRGIITAVEGNKATLLTDSGKIDIRIHNTGDAVLKRLLNTLVRIRGCLLAEWDAQTRQVKVGEMRLRNPSIEVDRLPEADPFSAPAKTISNLLLFDLRASGFQRVKISGQIVHARGGEFFLMQEGKGLRFRPVNGTELRAGDLVDVVGIPDLSGPSPQLHEAVVRKTGAAALPPPVEWPDPENPGMPWDAIRVQTEARLIGIHHAGPDWVLELQTGLRACRALVKTSMDLAAAFPLGSRLRVSGVYAALESERRDDRPGFELLLNSDADIQLLQRPPWWNLRRLLFIVATLVLTLTAAAIWISQLRRKVEQRTALLEREHARREHAERQRAVEFERSRIARDLHDDLGSSLTE
ncbi:MAG: PA14 domain-containing protein, partial [Verrucomicrobia bacterium]|nr:PA14 domain-containing protein [Verrucomicrobiota bacterium]